jgi:hypothetical protein
MQSNQALERDAHYVRTPQCTALGASSDTARKPEEILQSVSPPQSWWRLAVGDNPGSTVPSAVQIGAGKNGPENTAQGSKGSGRRHGGALLAAESFY